MRKGKKRTEVKREKNRCTNVGPRSVWDAVQGVEASWLPILTFYSQSNVSISNLLVLLFCIKSFQKVPLCFFDKFQNFVSFQVGTLVQAFSTYQAFYTTTQKL